MARHLRVQFPGAIYHVTCRMIGDGRLEHSRLFVDDEDRKRFLDQLAERVEQYHIRLYLYCQMVNHFHVVYETPEGNGSKFMQSLLTAYTVYYNLRHRRHGHLLDGRYKAKLVEGDEYLLALSRYVHLNPVRVSPIKDQPIEERIKILREYPWSSYRGYIGKTQALKFVEYRPILAQVSGPERHWAGSYRRFVEAGLAEDDADFELALKRSPRSIGSDGFRGWVDELYLKQAEKHGRTEDVSLRHVTEPLTAETVLEVLAEVFGVGVGEFKRRRRDSVLRPVAARFLVRYAGQSQRDVARTLNVGSGSAVSKRLASLSGQLAKDRQLRALLAQAEKRLASLRSVTPRKDQTEANDT